MRHHQSEPNEETAGERVAESVCGLASPDHSTRLVAWVLGGLLAFVLYRMTMAPGLLWGDSGESQLHTLAGGWRIPDQLCRSHLVYYGVARFFAKLFSYEPTHAANLTACVSGALTIANLAWISFTLCRSRVASVGCVLMVALSHTLWQSSTSAEVMATTAAGLSAELALLIKLLETRRLRWLIALAVVDGLAISNHNLALLMWPVYGILAWQSRKRWPWPPAKTLAAAAMGCTVGLLPILSVAVSDWLSQGSLLETAHSFLVGPYGHRVFNLSGLDRLIGRSIGMTALNFPTPIILFAVPGCIALKRRVNSDVWRLMVGGWGLYTLFAIRYEVPDQHIFLVPSFLFLAIFAGVGLDRWFDRKRSAFSAIAIIVLSAISPLVYAAAPPLLREYEPQTSLIPQRSVPYRDPFDWFLQPWRTGYDGPERFARETLDTLPTDAYLVVDTTLRPTINYLQMAEELRRDVQLESWFVDQPWFEPLDEDQRNDLRIRKLREGLLFLGSDDPTYWPTWLQALDGTLEPAGHVFRVLEKPQPSQPVERIP